MICRNCKFGLQGSEKFCPNCGAPLTEKETERAEILLPQTPSVFFSPEKETAYTDNEGSQKEDIAVFSDRKKRDKSSKRSKNTSKAPVALLLVIILLILTTGLFVAIEHFGLAPAIMQYISTPTAQSPQTTKNEAAALNFDNSQSVISPDISYSPAQAYISRNNALALRKGPDDSYGIVMTLEPGLQVQIIGGTSVNDLWVYVYVPVYNCYGWICASYISLYSGSDYTVPDITSEQSTQATGSFEEAVPESTANEPVSDD